VVALNDDVLPLIYTNCILLVVYMYTFPVHIHIRDWENINFDKTPKITRLSHTGELYRYLMRLP